MRVDVLALQRFYASPLGDAARRMAQRRLVAAWPNADGLDVLGVGYALPYIERFQGKARRVAALMPAAQGAERWPAEGGALTVLSCDDRLPFMDSVFDRVVMVHALEEAEHARALLREVWRVMAPEGRLVVIAANRWSLWAQADATPFGHGQPFSRRQLAALLTEAMFEPIASARALYVPPIAWGPLAQAAEAFERVGEWVWPALGGLVMMESVKRLYAETGRSERRVLLAKAPARASAQSPRGWCEYAAPEA
jgi:SAM-dependent methyltransferase